MMRLVLHYIKKYSTFFVYLEIDTVSLFPRPFSLRMKTISTFFLPGGVFLPCDHGLFFFPSAHARIQPINQSINQSINQDSISTWFFVCTVLIIKIKMPNEWRTIKSLVHKKIDFTVDEGKEWLNSSLEKIIRIFPSDRFCRL